MRSILPLAFWLCWVNMAFAQTPVLDSLYQQASTMERDTNLAEVYRNIAYNFTQVNLDSALLFGKKSLALTKDLDFESGNMKALYTLGTVFYKKGEIDSAKLYLNNALAKAIELKNRSAEEMCYNVLSFVAQIEGNAEDAMKYNLQSYRICEEKKDTLGIAIAANGLANLYKDQLNFEKSGEYYEKSENLLRSFGHEYFLSIVLSNYGAIIKDSLRKVNKLQESMAISEKLGDQATLAASKHFMGSFYKDKEDCSKAIPYYEASNAMLKQIGDVHKWTTSCTYLAYCHYELGNVSDAESYAKKVVETSNEKSYSSNLWMIYDILANIHADKKEYQTAYKYMVEKSIIVDTLFNQERTTIINELEIQYETEKKDKELTEQKLAIAQGENQRSRLLLGGLLLFGLGGLGFLWYSNKEKNKKKEAAMALEYQRKETENLRALDTMKSNFFANISHEFRTPLTLILAPLREMIDGTFKRNKGTYYKMMHRNGERLLGLVNQMLDLSKLESKKMDLEVVKGDVVPFIRSIVESFESMADMKDIEFERQYEIDTLSTFYDEDKLQKIINNLMSNAFRYTPEDGMVAVTLGQEGDAFYVEIKDTGVGIPEDQIEEVFNRFYQINNAEDGTMGSSGIGLALTKELTQLHHGTISVSSTEGLGSTFKVTIPTSDSLYANDVKLEKEKREVITPITMTDAQKGKAVSNYVATGQQQVLVVEDNPDVRMYVKDILSEEYEVLEAENGKLGVSAAQENLPDLIITDVMMPEMDGYGLNVVLKKDVRTSHIPIIMLTARSMQEDKLQGLETGADAYLTKPFDKEELMLRVRKLIEQREQLKVSFKGNSLVKTDANISSVDEDFLKRAVEAVHEHIEDESFSVVVLGQELGMSRAQLFRKLKALTGDSPSKFIRTIRLNQAKHLLEKQTGNISEVAFATGFNSLAYFTKCFKEQFEINPSELLEK